ncbi:MAG: carbohydrate-binding domain-containing protein [Lachnospiraceae bacterium]
MVRKGKYIAIFIMTCMVITVLNECSNNSNEISPTSEVATTEISSASSSETATTVATPVNTDLIEFKAKDIYTDFQTVAYTDIELRDNGTKAGDGYEVNGNTITIVEEGTYVITGTLTDGQLIINTDKESDVRLVFNDVSITSTTLAPIYVKQADKVIISLPEGTNNTITDTITSTDGDEEITAAIYSKEDLSINGSGNLVVHANANDGITSKDTLKITGGNITIQATDDGIVGKDSILIKDGVLTVTCTGDGLKSTSSEVDCGYIYIENGTYVIHAGNDGIQAETSLLIMDGNFDITTGEVKMPVPMQTISKSQEDGEIGPQPEQTTDEETTQSAKGIKASGYLEINGGNYMFDTPDDTIHSNDTVSVNGGTIQVKSGDDGIHADSVLEIADGTITVEKSYEGLEAASINISGGVISVTASDDGINAAGGADSSSLGDRPGRNNFNTSTNASIEINGGDLYVDASGDGLDSNGTITINDGTVIINGAMSSGNGYFDCDGTFLVNGGILLGLGGSGMLVTPSDSSAQNSITVIGDTYKAGSEISIKDSTGKVLYSYVTKKSFTAMTFSSLDIQVGESYDIYVNGVLLKTIEATGVSSGGSSSNMGPGNSDRPNKR